MEKLAWETTATLMTTHAEVDSDARQVMARQLSGEVATAGAATLEEVRARNTEHRENFAILDDVLSVLPRAEGQYGTFFLPNTDTFRAVQANVVSTMQLDHGYTYHYLVGARNLVIPKQPKIPFTELLLWPANTGGKCYDRYDNMYDTLPRTVAVPTAHYEVFQAYGQRNRTKQLSPYELKEAFDSKSGNLNTRYLGSLSLILGWWKKDPLYIEREDGSVTIDMATPKKRWGYQGQKFDGVIDNITIARFGTLDRLPALLNDFGLGKAAAARLRKAIKR